jgi:hypothetical protein
VEQGWAGSQLDPLGLSGSSGLTPHQSRSTAPTPSLRGGRRARRAECSSLVRALDAKLSSELLGRPLRPHLPWHLDRRAWSGGPDRRDCTAWTGCRAARAPRTPSRRRAGGRGCGDSCQSATNRERSRGARGGRGPVHDTYRSLVLGPARHARAGWPVSSSWAVRVRGSHGTTLNRRSLGGGVRPCCRPVVPRHAVGRSASPDPPVTRVARGGRCAMRPRLAGPQGRLPVRRPGGERALTSGSVVRGVPTREAATATSMRSSRSAACSRAKRACRRTA